MPNYLLIVDDTGSLQLPVERLTAKLISKVVTVPSVAAAKRKLIQEVPLLVICNMELNNEAEAGLKFAAELNSHPVLAEIPVLLTAENLVAGLLEKARSAGAKAVLQWPGELHVLQEKLAEYVPGLLPPPAKQAAAAASSAVSAGDKVVPGVAGAAKPPPAPELEEKIKRAQTLLARVLHSVKTSDLLTVAELEDIPNIVLEMTRSICVAANTRAAANIPTHQGTSTKKPGSSDEIQIELEQAFHLKHR